MPVYRLSAMSGVIVQPASVRIRHVSSDVEEDDGSTQLTFPNMLLSPWWSIFMTSVSGERLANPFTPLFSLAESKNT
ncbi:hypothetical protein FACS1894204_13710 [Synergistales bacterium]|nr:hypothetical protein FACS1894204_13710 [Synergistales bacterium]